jgi:hypothetical protein
MKVHPSPHQENKEPREPASGALASMILPEPGYPHTMVNFDPFPDFSIGEIVPDE